MSEINETAVKFQEQVKPPPVRCPANFFYSVGTDYGVTKRLHPQFRLSWAESWSIAPRVFETTLTTANIPGGTGALYRFRPLAQARTPSGLNNGAVGFKYNFFDRFAFLPADLLFQNGQQGLSRQAVTPLRSPCPTLGRKVLPHHRTSTLST